MSELIMLDQDSEMSYEQILELMADISVKRTSNPKVVINLLQILQKTSISLELVERTKLEKLLRELANFQPDIFSPLKKEF